MVNIYLDTEGRDKTGGILRPPFSFAHATIYRLTHFIFKYIDRSCEYLLGDSPAASFEKFYCTSAFRQHRNVISVITFKDAKIIILSTNTVILKTAAAVIHIYNNITRATYNGCIYFYWNHKIAVLDQVFYEIGEIRYGALFDMFSSPLRENPLFKALHVNHQLSQCTTVPVLENNRVNIHYIHYYGRYKVYMMQGYFIRCMLDGQELFVNTFAFYRVNCLHFFNRDISIKDVESNKLFNAIISMLKHPVFATPRIDDALWLDSVYNVLLSISRC